MKQYKKKEIQDIIELIGLSGVLALSVVMTISIWMAFLLSYIHGGPFSVRIFFNEFNEGIMELVMFTSITIIGAITINRIVDRHYRKEE